MPCGVQIFRAGNLDNIPAQFPTRSAVPRTRTWSLRSSWPPSPEAKVISLPYVLGLLKHLQKL